MKFKRHSVGLGRAFMMIELLIVVAIILVLFVLYWSGGFGGKAKKQQSFSGCSKNLQFIHTALLTYSADNNDRFPTVARAETSDAPLSLLVPKYISQTGPFICPASDDKPLAEGESFAKKRISYAYVMGLSRSSEPSQFVMSDEQVDTRPKDAGNYIFARTNQPPGDNHGRFGGNLLLVDGSVQTVAAKAPSAVTFTNATLFNPKPKRQ